MLKLLFWGVIAAIAYFWYKGQQVKTARQQAELFKDAHKNITEDVEVEIIEIEPRDSRP